MQGQTDTETEAGGSSNTKVRDGKEGYSKHFHYEEQVQKLLTNIFLPDSL